MPINLLHLKLQARKLKTGQEKAVFVTAPSGTRTTISK
jgi:hypothetical protein